MTHAVVRFDAELIVHRAQFPIGCPAAVVRQERTPWGPPAQMVRVVRRCTRDTGHRSSHHVAATGRRAVVSTATLCGQSLTEGAWIDWVPSENDPQCASCHGAPRSVPLLEEQGALL